MDQTQPAGEAERIGRSRSRSAQGSGSAARSFSRSRSRSPAREPRDVARHEQPAWSRASTSGGINAAELTATAEPPLMRPDQADQKYEEASAVAANACAEDTKGQTCWICFDDGSKEGLVRGCACRGGAGFAHVSCLAEQAKVLVAEAENNLDYLAQAERWERWHTCRLCEQKYHGVVRCALGWACWKTYSGRPEGDRIRLASIEQLGNGLYVAGQHEDALSVKMAELATLRRLGAAEGQILAVQANLAMAYFKLRRLEAALSMRREIYSGHMRLNGEEHRDTIIAALNYATSLNSLKRFKEAKSLIRKTRPVAERVFGENDQAWFTMRRNYAWALYGDPVATPDDLHEAVTTLEETVRTARRVFGGAHPHTLRYEEDLRQVRHRRFRARQFTPGARVS